MLERLLLCLLVSPIRIVFEVLTIIKIFKDDEYYGKRGDYKDKVFLNRCFYVLFNADYPELLLSENVKKKLAEAQERNRQAELKKKQQEEERKAQMAKLQGEIASCNVKLCLFGSLHYDGDGSDLNKYFGANFYNKEYAEKNLWRHTYGATTYVNSDSGRELECFYVKELIVNGVKMNNKVFSDNLNFNLKPGTYNIKISVSIKHKVSGWSRDLNCPIMVTPADVPDTKIVKYFKTFELNNVVINQGYKYNLALFARSYPTWLKVYEEKSGAYLYKTRTDVKSDFSFVVASESELKQMAKTTYIEDGIVINQVN